MVSHDLNVTFLCMTKKCDLLGNFLGNFFLKIAFLSHTEKSNIQIRTVMRLNNYPLLLQMVSHVNAGNVLHTTLLFWDYLAASM